MSISLSFLISAFYPNFDPQSTKLHIAQWNNFEHPIDVFCDGSFDAWQAEQTQKNFGREFVLSLIQTHTPDLWLFAGIWQRQGDPVFAMEKWCDKHDKSGKRRPLKKLWHYDLRQIDEVEPLVGRLHVRYVKKTRAPYRLLETIIDEITISSLIEQPELFPRFAGYGSIHLSMEDIRTMYRHSPEDWMTALKSVGGVYLITDAGGQHYVGSAVGQNGFWGRWEEYSKTGHGGNKLLKKLLGKNPVASSVRFSFSIIETASSAATAKEVIRRESHWKRVLGTRAFGLNDNYATIYPP